MTEPNPTWSDYLSMSDDEDIVLRDIHCDHCGFITGDQFAYGLHSIECAPEDTEPTYTCSHCKDDRTLIWGMETRKFCHIIKEAYEKITSFRKNLQQAPAYKSGKMFLSKYAETFEWTTNEGREEHFSWYVNAVLPVICL